MARKKRAADKVMCAWFVDQMDLIFLILYIALGLGISHDKRHPLVGITENPLGRQLQGSDQTKMEQEMTTDKKYMIPVDKSTSSEEVMETMFVTNDDLDQYDLSVAISKNLIGSHFTVRT